MRRLIAFLLLVTFVAEVSWAGIGGDQAMYVGGTVASLKDRTVGQLSVKDEKIFVFQYGNSNFTIPYDRIVTLEYGQKAGRRIGAAVLLGAFTYGAGGLLALSKKRRHYLTIGFKSDDGKDQAAVFELGKNVIRVSLASLEARTGKKIEYQDDEARKTGRGN